MLINTAFSMFSGYLSRYCSSLEIPVRIHLPIPTKHVREKPTLVSLIRGLGDLTSIRKTDLATYITGEK